MPSGNIRKSMAAINELINEPVPINELIKIFLIKISTKC